MRDKYPEIAWKTIDKFPENIGNLLEKTPEIILNNSRIICGNFLENSQNISRKNAGISLEKSQKNTGKTPDLFEIFKQWFYDEWIKNNPNITEEQKKIFLEITEDSLGK